MFCIHVRRIPLRLWFLKIFATSLTVFSIIGLLSLRYGWNSKPSHLYLGNISNACFRQQNYVRNGPETPRHYLLYSLLINELKATFCPCWTFQNFYSYLLFQECLNYFLPVLSTHFCCRFCGFRSTSFRSEWPTTLSTILYIYIVLWWKSNSIIYLTPKRH